MGSRGQQDGVMLFFQLGQGDIFSHPAVVDDLHSHGTDDVDVPLEEGAGLPVGRDSHGNHAAAVPFGERLINGDRIPFQRQVIGRCQAGRTGTHYGHVLPFARLGLHGGEVVPLPLMVRGGAFEEHDADGFIHILPAAGGLAGVRTDPAAD